MIHRIFHGSVRMGCLGLALAGLMAVSGCGAGAVDDDGRPLVVTTTTMITDLVRQIAGEHVRIQGIMQPAEDPHVYKVRPRDAQRVAAADLVFMNGLHLEATLDAVIRNNAQGHVVRLAESPSIPVMAGEDDPAAPDPHVWFNVQYFKVFAESARDALIELDPVHAEDYRQRAAAYLQQLDELDAWVRQQLDAIPREQRVMITSHDAFRYFGQAYGVEVHGVIGMSTDEQVTPRTLQNLEQLVRERGIKALFIETSVGAALNNVVAQVAQRTNATVGGTLYSDALGEPGSGADTYIDMVRHNVRTLVEALR